MKKIFLSLFALTLLAACGEKAATNAVAPTPKTETPTPAVAAAPNEEETAKAILKLLKDDDIATINKDYIHPQFGFYNIYRMGVMDLFEHHLQLKSEKDLDIKSLETTETPLLSGFSEDKNIPELSRTDVEFDCGEMKWKKEGFFINNNLTYPSLPEVMKRIETDREEKVSAQDKERAEFVQKNSVRVVSTNSDIIFYLTKIDGKWYITLVDRVTTDCSA